MPNNEEHCADSLKRYGKTFAELHAWMDEPSFLLGSSHRRYRHDPNVTPDEAKAIFGENADNACLDHIRLDELESRNRIPNSDLPDISGDEMEIVLPVVRFTLETPAGTWKFESEAISFSKDGKTHYCVHSRTLLKRSIQNNATEQKDDNNEDEEWRNNEDDLNGNHSEFSTDFFALLQFWRILIYQVDMRKY